jgi:AcrR family transcriptional regulator
MPRIAAASIEEHVRRQTARITTEAWRLFTERGYRHTDLGDIAAAVGLARNSLYRYFPGKDHILLACIEASLEPHLAVLDGLACQRDAPQARIAAWVDAQFDLALGPDHATLELSAQIQDADPELARRIGELHQAPNRSLGTMLADLPGCEDPALYAAMLGSMVLAATREAQAGGPGRQSAVRRELQAAVARLLNHDTKETHHAYAHEDPPADGR